MSQRGGLKPRLHTTRDPPARRIFIIQTAKPGMSDIKRIPDLQGRAVAVENEMGKLVPGIV